MVEEYIEEMILPEVSRQLVGSRPSPHMRLGSIPARLMQICGGWTGTWSFFLGVLLISSVSTISPTPLLMHCRRYIIFVTGSVIQQHFKTDRSTDRGNQKDLEHTRSSPQIPGGIETKSQKCEKNGMRYSRTVWPLKMEPIWCTETSATAHQQRRPQLHRRGSLKSRKGQNISLVDGRQSP